MANPDTVRILADPKADPLKDLVACVLQGTATPDEMDRLAALLQADAARTREQQSWRSRISSLADRLAGIGDIPGLQDRGVVTRCLEQLGEESLDACERSLAQRTDDAAAYEQARGAVLSAATAGNFSESEVLSRSAQQAQERLASSNQAVLQTLAWPGARAEQTSPSPAAAAAESMPGPSAGIEPQPGHPAESEPGPAEPFPGNGAYKEPVVADGGQIVSDQLPPAGPTQTPLPAAFGSPEETSAEAPQGLGKPKDLAAKSLAAAEIVDAALEALAKGRHGIAWHLLRQYPEAEPGAALLGSAVEAHVAATLADGSGLFEDRAREAVEHTLGHWQSDDASPRIEAVAYLLLMQSGLLLALRAPGSNSQTLLDVLLSNHAGRQPSHVGLTPPQMFPAHREMAHHVNEALGRTGTQQLLGSDVLSAVIGAEDWQSRLDLLHREIADWLERERRAGTINYAPATNVWRDWVRPEGAIGKFLTPIQRDRSLRVEAIHRQVDLFAPQQSIRETDERLRGAVARRSPIDGAARRQLLERAGKATELARQWTALAARAPAKASSQRQRATADVRRQLSDLLPKARAEVADGLGLTLEAAKYHAASKALDLLEQLLGQGNGISPAGPRGIDEQLNRDLLPLVGTRLQPGWALTDREAPIPTDRLIELARRSDEARPEDVARSRMHAGEFVEARLALGDPPEGRSPIHDELAQAIRTARENLNGRLREARSAVEHAERDGRIPMGEAEQKIATLGHLLEQTADPLLEDLGPAEAEFEEVRQRLARSIAEARRQMMVRIDAAALQDPDAITRVKQAADAGHFAIAEDLLNALEAGEALPEVAGPNKGPGQFDAFFPERCGVIAAWLREQPAGLAGVRNDLAHGRGLPAAWHSVVAQPADAAGLLEMWTECAKAPTSDLQAALRALFERLGFANPHLRQAGQPDRDSTEVFLRLEVATIKERSIVPLPEFGSTARGRYGILCLWRRRDPQDIVQAIGRRPPDHIPTLALFFGVLDADQRRRLAESAREGSLTHTLVIDDTLVAHLATVAEDRLSNLFACALPFTDSQPWTATGTPPPEMFYGRRRERRAVASVGGDSTNLIYGGRQLGKTALLKHVERVQSGDATIVRYISIAHIGVSGEPESIWEEVRQALADTGVGRSYSATQRTNARTAVERSINAWLSDERAPGRRVILLFDEADRFFQKDRESGFPATEGLRTLSVATDGRFKPVFSGLHNVQKLARDPNSPLAHLGQPLVVGPLLRGEDREEAEALVRVPFTALGYRLDADAVTRILSFANYYPSLVQFVCQNLLRAMRRQRDRSGPPWPIALDDVERVLDDRGIRDQAGERFRITLELDPRYELLALLSASFSTGDAEALVRGIDAADLRDLALLAWPQGFAGANTPDALEGLLAEMVGLGLLRQQGRERFALRSANLPDLLGSQAQIAQRIDDFHGRAAPNDPDPLEFRQPKKRDDWKIRSVLTAREEQELLTPLNGVVLLAGSALGGIDELHEWIRLACTKARQQHTEVTVQRLSNAKDLDRHVVRSGSGLLILLAPPDGDWTPAVLERCCNILAPKTSSKRYTRTVFVADQARAWEWFAPENRSLRGHLASNEGFRTMTLGPWSRDSVQLWLETSEALNSLPARLANRGSLLRATGGWTLLLRRLAAGPDPPFQHEEEVAAELLASCALPTPWPEPDAASLLAAIAEVESLRTGDEVIDTELVHTLHPELDPAAIERAAAWAQMIGLLANGPRGLEVNSVVRLLLSA